MANTLRIKRRAAGGAAGAPTSLANAELAFNEQDDVLYYGEGTGGAGGTATTVLAIGGSGAFATLGTTQTITGNKTFTGTVDLSGATLSGNTTFSNNLTVTGDLTVNGTTTSVNSAVVQVDDKNIELGSTASPSDAGADGGGITLLGTTNKTFNWVDATDSWTSSEHLDLASGKDFKVAGTSVLSGSALGSGVTGSSLTSVGTLTSGTWSASTIALNKGGTGATTASGARTALGLAIGSDVQAYDAELAALAGVTSAANKVAYFTGSGTADVADFSAFGRSLVDDADAAAGRTTLGLGTMATQASSSVSITGGSIDGITFDGGTF